MPCVVRIIIFPVVFGSKRLSGDFEDVLPVTRDLFLKRKYDYEIMKICDESEAEIKFKWKKTGNERRIGRIWILSSCFAFKLYFEIKMLPEIQTFSTT